MVSKKEFLEEKTVKELWEMAKAKSISGYSGKRKAELVDMIAENYTKDEIEDFPEEKGGAEKEAPGTEKKLKSRPVAIGLAVVLIPALIGLGLFLNSGGSVGNIYVSENYGFSLSYPDNWVVESRGGSFRISENVPENQKAGSFQIFSLDLVSGGEREVGGVQGIEFSMSQYGIIRRNQVVIRKNQVVFTEENKVYTVEFYSLENEYGGNKPHYDAIVGSLVLSENELASPENENFGSYKNDNFGVYFNYPSGWVVVEENYPSLTMMDNESSGSMGAQLSIQVSRVDEGGSKEIGGQKGIEIINTGIDKTGKIVMNRALLVVNENRLYQLSAVSPASLYDNYAPHFNSMIESFTFSE